MKILDIDSKIIKWSNTNTNFRGGIIEADKPNFVLITNPIIGNVFNVKNNLYITNVDTDFILDIDIESVLSFNKDEKQLTTKDLYEFYSKIKDNESKVILEAEEKLRILWTVIHMNRDILKRPFENLEDDLKTLLKEDLTKLN